MRKILLIAIGIVILGASFLGAYFIVKSNTKVKPKVEKIVKTVFVETVKNTTVPIMIPANGSLIAKNRFELYSEVQGIFESTAHDFKPGQYYKKGETLIKVNSSEYFASVQAAKSELYNLITSIIPDLRLDFPNNFKVWDIYLKNFDMNKTTLALPAINDEKVSYFITGRGILTSFYNVKNLEQRLSKYRLSAPFNGVLTEALVTKGTLVRSGQKLGEFIDPSVFELELAISKTYTDLLKIGESVNLKTLEGNDSFVGKVTRINSRIDQTTQTVKVYVEVKSDGLKEGMYLEAQIKASDEPSAIRISRKLLVNNSEIYILKDSVLDIIEIEPVFFSPNDVVIKGVPDGTKILSKPLASAFAGMLVKTTSEEDSNTTESNAKALTN